MILIIREHHNPSDPPSTTSVDCKLVTHEDESIPSVTIQDEDHTDIMDELAAMLRSTNQLRSETSEREADKEKEKERQHGGAVKQHDWN